jgi:hypothetical protein
MFSGKHRVSIKSFPDYKHLQENYVEYKHIFFFFDNVTHLNKFFYK